MKERYDETVLAQLLLAYTHKSNTEIATMYNEKLGTSHAIRTMRRNVSKLRTKMNLPNIHKITKETDINTVNQSKNEFGYTKISQVADTRKIEQKGDTLTEDIRKSDFNVSEGTVVTIEDALNLSKVDTTQWEVDHHIWNSWTTSAIGEDGKFKQINNVQVKLWFKRIIAAQSSAWKNFVEGLSAYTPDYSSIEKTLLQQREREIQVRDNLLELSLPDLHIGKQAWNEESGENFDTKEAMKRYNKAVDSLLSQVNLATVEKIILPIGNDMLNIDTKQYTTTAGTPQACDSRWQQMFRKAKKLLIENIDRLALIAPVEILVVPGNHDNQTMFYLGDSLLSWYRTSSLITVNNAPTQRKYYHYGVNLVGFTHGNEEKHAELPIIMATEKKELWAATQYREFHLGHFHKSKSMKFVDVDEFPGCKVRIIPSLSGADAWHSAKGYMSMKAAEAFLYNRENGLIANYKFNILK